MAKYRTLAQIREKIKREVDLQEEVFVRPCELLEYINEAIDEAEAEIHSMYEDYFLSRATINLEPGQEEYDLPENIYAHKIRRIVYNNDSSVYTVTRIRDWRKFEAQNIARNFAVSDLYRFFLINDQPAQPKILLVPKSREQGPFLSIWYLRQANHLVNDTDICDIPEFYNFIYAYVKVKIYDKEVHPGLQRAEVYLEQQRKLMQGTLATMVPDAENEIELDNEIYEEHN